MKTNISQHFKTEKELTETVLEESPEIIPDSRFKNSLIEVVSITTFTFRFLKEVIKPPYEFNKEMKQSF